MEAMIILCVKEVVMNKNMIDGTLKTGLEIAEQKIRGIYHFIGGLL